jgi:hypothetical protein
MEDESSLYEACVGYIVGEQSANNSWATVCRHVDKLVREGHPRNEIADTLTAVEQQVCADFGRKKPPGAWRSAKSVALSAVTLGVPLVVNGEVQGKTAVSKANKEQSALLVGPASTPSSTSIPYTHVFELVHKAVQHISLFYPHTLNDIERLALGNMVKALNEVCKDKGITHA